jgi:hypothetical protein
MRSVFSFPSPSLTITPRSRLVDEDDRLVNAYVFSRSRIRLSGVEDKDNEQQDLVERFQEFLDLPFYDPDAVLADESEDSNSISKQFATFVKTEYETAEALLVGGYLFLLVIATQEIVRSFYSR